VEAILESILASILDAVLKEEDSAAQPTPKHKKQATAGS